MLGVGCSEEENSSCFHYTQPPTSYTRAFMRIPILKVGRVLIVPIQVDMDDQTVVTLQENILSELGRTNARGVLIDISMLEMVDSFIGRMLSDIAAMARIMDARTVVVGMQPAVAITLVELGLELNGVDTVLNVDEGFKLLRAEFPLDETGDDEGDVVAPSFEGIRPLGKQSYRA